MNISLRCLLLIAVARLLVVAATPVVAQEAPLCRGHRDDRSERPAPEALLPRLSKAFGVAPDVLRGTSSVRCAGGRLLGCATGANLNCGRANTSRRSQGGDAFCRDNPGSDVVPMAATGHDTIYDWHCAGSKAVAGRAVEGVDGLGFMTRNWRVVP